MTNAISLVQPTILIENKLSINSFLKNSYDETRKLVEGNVAILQEEVSFIKAEFSFFYHETGMCLKRMALPVNNFLKDFKQIENELLLEVSKESPYYMCMNGEMITVEKVLTMPMEENR